MRNQNRTALRRAGFMYRPYLFISLLLGISALPLLAANELAALQACKLKSDNEMEVAECLSLAFEESEVALAGVEESMRSRLDGSFPLAGASPVPEVQSDSGRVIVIVNGVATPVDDSSVTVEDVQQLERQKPQRTKPLAADLGAAAQFAAEAGLFRSFRDNRCAWQATMYAPLESAWYEIACRVSMNREQMGDLRAQAGRQTGVQQEGYAVRGLLEQHGAGAALRRCGEVQWWQLTGGADVMARLNTAYNELGLAARESAYVELRGRRETLGASSTVGYQSRFRVTKITTVRELHDEDCSLIDGAKLVQIDEISKPLDTKVADPLPVTPEALDRVVRDDTSTVLPVVNAKPLIVNPAQPETSSKTDIGVVSGPPQSVDSEIFAVSEFVSSASTPPVQSPITTLIGTSGPRAVEALYGYFQNWVAACPTDGNLDCWALADAEPASLGALQVRIDRSSNGDYQVSVTPQSQGVKFGRDIGLYVDGKPVGNRRLPSRLTQVGVGSSLVLAAEQDAQHLIRNLRQGKAFKLAWQDRAGQREEIAFSLWGITRALSFYRDVR